MIRRKSTYKFKITQPRYIQRGREHFEKLVGRHGLCMEDERYRKMLDILWMKDYVESSSTGQAGSITAIVRDRNGFPVCVEVSGATGLDYISIDRIDYWEQWAARPDGYGYYGDNPNVMCWEWED